MFQHCGQLFLISQQYDSIKYINIIQILCNFVNIISTIPVSPWATFHINPYFRLLKNNSRLSTG